MCLVVVELVELLVVQNQNLTMKLFLTSMNLKLVVLVGSLVVHMFVVGLQALEQKVLVQMVLAVVQG